MSIWIGGPAPGAYARPDQTLYGGPTGAPVQPWRTSVLGKDRAAGNLSVSLPYVLAGNGTTRTVLLANIPTPESFTQADLNLRVVVKVTTTATTSATGPLLYLFPASTLAGAGVSGVAQTQVFWSNVAWVSAGQRGDLTDLEWVFDYRVPAGARYVRLNATSAASDPATSTLTVTSITATRIDSPRGTINLGYDGNGGRDIDTNSGLVYIDTPITLGAGTTRATNRLRQVVGAESTVFMQPTVMDLYGPTYNGGGFTIPLFDGRTASVQSDNSTCQVWGVQAATSTAQEYRGDAHGGEIGRSEFQLSAAVTTTPAAGTSETLAVYDSSGVTVGDTYALDNERVQVTAIPDATHITVTRSYGARTGVPATHAINVTGFNYARDHRIEYDTLGTGAWKLLTEYKHQVRASRVRLTKRTKLYNSDGLAAPFANVDTVHTYFADGMTRCDRTTTFLQDRNVNRWFLWMLTLNRAAPFQGRLGTGLTVLGQTDQTTAMPVPAVPTVTANTAAGTLAASTQYEYAISFRTAPAGYGPGALTQGETLPSASTSVTTGAGATNQNVVTWTTPAGVGVGDIAIYRRTGGTGNFQFMVHFAQATGGSWTDTGSVTPGAGVPATTNTYVGNDDERQVTSANWGALRETTSGLVVGVIVDPAEIAAQRGVVGYRGQLIRNLTTNTANKIYFHADFDATVSAAQGIEPTYLVPAGITYKTTAWRYSYMPTSALAWHQETADRAAGIDSLKAIYPNT